MQNFSHNKLMPFNIPVIAQSELGPTELIPAILVVTALIIAIAFLALLTLSLLHKSYQLAALNCCLVLGVGFVLQPWTLFYESTQGSPDRFPMQVRMVAWSISLLISIAAFAFCLVARRKELLRTRKRKRISRSGKH
jgi:uncharacterized membrane protein